VPIISSGAVLTVGESTSAPPPRIVVRGDATEMLREFPVLAGLEPVAWVPEGLVVAPFAGGRDATEQAARLAAVSLPWRTAVGGGVYRRSPGHAPAPPGVLEVVLVDGEGFGLAEHATTGMCLDMLADLPDGPALDAGCGSGILALAWARLGRGPVLAVDLEPRAVWQARESAWASGLDALISVRRASLGALPHDEVHARVVLANAPVHAQRALLTAGDDPVPLGLLVSGLQQDSMDEVAAAWAERGLRVVRREAVGRWQAALLRPS
jgi:ribosomal protein L11 methylase PrmA